MNLAYRWFCRLSLEDEVPNHSTFSKKRHGRFRDSDLFHWLFNEVLRRCMDASLVKGEGFAVDASIIKADASRQRGVPDDEQVNWSDPALSTRPFVSSLKPSMKRLWPKRYRSAYRWLILNLAGPQLQVAQRSTLTPRVI
ncbi:hypothetical protein PsexTeo8_39900 [Pseudomonas extremaustralis]|nr:hypothetical protein [Pseudomonas extremaustralis]